MRIPVSPPSCWQKKADKVLICFEEARELVGGGDKVVLTGSPVRGEIVFAEREKAREKLKLRPEDKFVVSFWGSMGAKYMNEHMAGMLALETKKGTTFSLSMQPARRHSNGCQRWQESEGLS